MRRIPVFVMLACFVCLFAVTANAIAMALIGALDPHQNRPSGGVHRRVVGRGQIRFDGAGPEKWALRFRREHNRYRRLHRMLLQRPDVVEAMNLACATYGNCALMWRIVRRESNYVAYAKNPASTAAGLGQFLDSTWAHTPYGRFSPYSPYANALAIGWMLANGHSSAWSPLP
jgi:hypothetical protein